MLTEFLRVSLTEVVLALHHLCDVDLGGSLWNLHNLVVAHFRKAVLEHARDQLTGCVIPSAHATLIHHLPRAQVLITARTLRDKGGGERETST